MILQPLVYFAAVAWALSFIAFGLFVAFRRATPTFSERAIGLTASLLVAALGSGILIGIMYVIEELI